MTRQPAITPTSLLVCVINFKTLFTFFLAVPLVLLISNGFSANMYPHFTMKFMESGLLHKLFNCGKTDSRICLRKKKGSVRGKRST